MASFSGRDYDYLFALGQRLYYSDSAAERKEIATILMAMTESVRGQQAGWPNIARRYRPLTVYPPRRPYPSTVLRMFPKSETLNVIGLRTVERKTE